MSYPTTLTYLNRVSFSHASLSLSVYTHIHTHTLCNHLIFRPFFILNKVVIMYIDPFNNLLLPTPCVVYCNTYTTIDISRDIIKHDIRTSMNEWRHFFIKIKSLTLYGNVSCVWEMSWRQRQTAILTPSSSDHSSTSSSSWLGLLNRGSLRAQSPLSAAGSQFGILSLTDSYYFVTFTCFPCSSAYLHRCIYWLTARLRVNI